MPLTNKDFVSIDQNVQQTLRYGIEQFKGNVKPVLNFRTAATNDTIGQGGTQTFCVSVTALTGDQLTYPWKVDDAVTKSGGDSSLTISFSPPSTTPNSVEAIYSVSSGVKDSTT